MNRIFFLISAIILTTLVDVSAQSKIADHLANYTPLPNVEVDYCHLDLGIQIIGCENNNGTAIITMVLTNHSEDEVIEFWGSDHSAGSGTIAYDDAGYINSKDISVGFANHELSDGVFEELLPKEIPVRFKVVILNLNPQASKILRLDMSLYSHGAMNFDYEKPIAIKNLPFTKD